MYTPDDDMSDSPGVLPMNYPGRAYPGMGQSFLSGLAGRFMNGRRPQGGQDGQGYVSPILQGLSGLQGRGGIAGGIGKIAHFLI